MTNDMVLVEFSFAEAVQVIAVLDSETTAWLDDISDTGDGAEKLNLARQAVLFADLTDRVEAAVYDATGIVPFECAS